MLLAAGMTTGAGAGAAGFDEVGAFDPIKESALVKTISAYIAATGHTLGQAKESISKEAITEKLKGLTEKK